MVMFQEGQAYASSHYFVSQLGKEMLLHKGAKGLCHGHSASLYFHVKPADILNGICKIKNKKVKEKVLFKKYLLTKFGN